MEVNLKDCLIEDEIESIEFLGERETIDITVEDTHMFFANGIYTHNSGFNKEITDEQSIGKAIEVYQVADWWISFNQSVPQQEIQECNATLLKNRLGPKGCTLRVKYNPNQCTFIEMEEVSRVDLLNKEQIQQVQGGLDLIKKKVMERRNASSQAV